MRARKTPSCNDVYRLVGGTPDNNLPVRKGVGLEGLASDDPCAGQPFVVSVWVPDDAERAALATGSNVELAIIGHGVPPISMTVTDEQPVGEAPLEEGEQVWTRIPADTVRILLDLLDPGYPATTMSALRTEPEVVELREALARDLALLEARARARGER